MSDVNRMERVFVLLDRKTAFTREFTYPVKGLWSNQITRAPIGPVYLERLEHLQQDQLHWAPSNPCRGRVVIPTCRVTHVEKIPPVCYCRQR